MAQNVQAWSQPSEIFRYAVHGLPNAGAGGRVQPLMVRLRSDLQQLAGPNQRVAHHLPDLSHLPCADESVYVREFQRQFFGISLHQTARHNHLFDLAPLLALQGFQNGVDRFFFCRFDKAAGIDNNHVGISANGLAIVGELDAVAFALQQAEHLLAVHLVLRAAQIDKADAPFGRRNSMLRRNYIVRRSRF